MNGAAEGVIEQVSFERTEIKSKGNVIVRNGSTHNPALVIKHKRGNQVIKLLSEVSTPTS